MQSNARLCGCAPLKCRGESSFGVQDEITSVVASAVFGAGRAFDELVQDIFANDFFPPLALAMEHRSVQQLAGDVDVIVAIPYAANFLCDCSIMSAPSATIIRRANWVSRRRQIGGDGLPSLNYAGRMKDLSRRISRRSRDGLVLDRRLMEIMASTCACAARS
jgi:hypothetical protein